MRIATFSHRNLADPWYLDLGLNASNCGWEWGGRQGNILILMIIHKNPKNAVACAGLPGVWDEHCRTIKKAERPARVIEPRAENQLSQCKRTLFQQSSLLTAGIRYETHGFICYSEEPHPRCASKAWLHTWLLGFLEAVVCQIVMSEFTSPTIQLTLGDDLSEKTVRGHETAVVMGKPHRGMSSQGILMGLGQSSGWVPKGIGFSGDV